MRRYLFAALLVSCRGPVYEGCPDIDVGMVVDRADALWDIQDDYDQSLIVCKPDLSYPCRDDVAACSPWIGRIYVRSDQPLGKAIAHELQHWHLWSEEEHCASHDEGCGWSYSDDEWVGDGE